MTMAEQIKAMKLGDTMKAGKLLGGLSQEEVELKLVETGKVFIFVATYLGIKLGEARFSSGRWSKQWM